MKRKLADVLIIEDDDDIGQSLGALLVERGFGAMAVRTGQEGLNLLEKGLSPRVIVLDPFTPNGWRAFRTEQLARPAWATIPVLVGGAAAGATGEEQRPSREHALARPLDITELLDLVTHYCRPWG